MRSITALCKCCSYTGTKLLIDIGEIRPKLSRILRSCGFACDLGPRDVAAQGARGLSLTRESRLPQTLIGAVASIEEHNPTIFSTRLFSPSVYLPNGRRVSVMAANPVSAISRGSLQSVNIHQLTLHEV